MRASPTGHIASLDGIRAVSFLIVFVSHLPLRRHYIAGDFGVTVFFFLSGFLITTLMRAEYQHKGAINLKYFWLRRGLRILPPFYLVLVAAILLTAAIYPPDTLHTAPIAAQLLHVTNYWAAIHGMESFPPGTEVYWSLAVEEHFYLVFPWLYVAMQRMQMTASQQAVLLWGLCALILIWRYTCVHVLQLPGVYLGVASDTRADPILFGCALAVWNNPVLDPPSHAPRIWKTVLLPAAALTLALSMMWRNVAFLQTWYFTIQGIALTPLFAAAVRFHDWPLFRWLSFRPLAFLGVLSYSMYLSHGVVLSAVAQLLPALAPSRRAALAFAVTLMLAWLMYQLVERRCARLRKRLTVG